MNTKPLTARIPAPLDEDLETLAIATQRSKTYHVTRAVTEYPGTRTMAVGGYRVGGGRG